MYQPTSLGLWVGRVAGYTASTYIPGFLSCFLHHEDPGIFALRAHDSTVSTAPSSVRNHAT